jgi:hypothetical protein
LSWIARQAAHRNSKRNFLTAGNSSTDNQAANLYLSIDDTATVTFTLDPQAAARKKASSSWLAAAFDVAAANSCLAAHATSIQSRIEGAVSAAHRATQNEFFFVDSVGHTHSKPRPLA